MAEFSFSELPFADDNLHWELRKEAFITNLITPGREGGWVDDPNDPGGKTKYGISKGTYPNVDIKNLTEEDAKSIYRRDYTKKGEDLFGRTNEAIKFMDMEVNMGYKSDTKKVLQKALNSLLPKNKQIPVDGKIGDITKNAIKTVQLFTSSQKIIDTLSKYQLEYYASLPDYKTIEKGRKYRASYNPIKED